MRSAVEQRVLKRLTPPKRQPPVVAATLKKVQMAIKQQQLLATVTLGGSTAKGTNLANDYDVDIFVRFSPEYDDKTLSDRLQKILKSVFKKLERVHGSRDYFHVQLGKFLFEFIPVQHITSWQEARNVTDMSPLHVEYVAKHIEEKPELAGDIRLTKQFCKAAKIYGAESYIGGFSGHVVDLLNIYYGGFRQLLTAAAKWPAKVIIDPEHHHDNPMVALNDAKVYAPLVIVDPIQPDRNSAAAVTELAFKRLKDAAKAYLAAQQEEFFIIHPLDTKSFKATHKDATIHVITLMPQAGKKDVVGAKCFKVYQHLTEHLLKAGFTIIESKWEFTPKKATLLFAVPKTLLPAEEEWVGPPIARTADVARFQQAHNATFTRSGKIYAMERRKYRDAKKLIADLLKTAYVRERVKSARNA